MIMKTIKSYYNVTLLYEIDYYNYCYKFKNEKEERRLIKID